MDVIVLLCSHNFINLSANWLVCKQVSRDCGKHICFVVVVIVVVGIVVCCCCKIAFCFASSVRFSPPYIPHAHITGVRERFFWKNSGYRWRDYGDGARSVDIPRNDSKRATRLSLFFFLLLLFFVFLLFICKQDGKYFNCLFERYVCVCALLW